MRQATRIWRSLLSSLVALILSCSGGAPPPGLVDLANPAGPADLSGGGGPVDMAGDAGQGAALLPVVWIPDYYGQRVRVRSGEGGLTRAVELLTPGCNPNSVAVNKGKLYVVCSGVDQIWVYDAAAVREATDRSMLTPSAAPKISSSEFKGLIGVAFDAQDSLWIASHDNDKVQRISAASLATASPAPDHFLVNTPGKPIAMTFDSDGSMWIVGDYGTGILLNVTADKLATGGDVAWRYCFSNNLAGCAQAAGTFNSPEGVALFNGQIWVSNNGGGSPGRELVAFRVKNGALVKDAVFGNRAAATGPFQCPGGLFATAQHLWVNDEGYGKANGTCGVNDQGTGVGAVLRFTSALLAAQSSDAAQILRFVNATSRPGFGGLYVEVR